jgi:hypothetical protein
MSGRTRLDDVIRNVAPGRQARFNLTAAQRAALADPDGRLALTILRHLIGARHVTPGAPVHQTPFTPEAVRRAALSLVYGTIGRAHARRLRARLVEQGILVPDGSYRPGYRDQAGDGPHRVPLYRIPRHLIHSIVRRARGTTPPAMSKPLGSGQVEAERISGAGVAAEAALLAARAVRRPLAARRDGLSAGADAQRRRAIPGVAVSRALDQAKPHGRSPC